MKPNNEAMIFFAQRMDQKGWVANHDGNLSVKLDSGYLLTPSGRAKWDLDIDSLIETDWKGQKIKGSGKAFSEFQVHQKIYEQRPDVNAVVHAHPPSSTAVGCAQQEMMTWAIPEAVVSLGPGVPSVGLHLPDSEELWSELLPLLPHYDAVMVGGNGVFTWGKDLEQAFLRLELVEHLAEIFLKSIALGGPSLLTAEQVGVLLEKRKKAGLMLPPDPARPQWFIQ